MGRLDRLAASRAGDVEPGARVEPAKGRRLKHKSNRIYGAGWLRVSLIPGAQQALVGVVGDNSSTPWVMGLGADTLGRPFFSQGDSHASSTTSFTGGIGLSHNIGDNQWHFVEFGLEIATGSSSSTGYCVLYIDGEIAIAEDTTSPNANLNPSDRGVTSIAFGAFGCSNTGAETVPNVDWASWVFWDNTAGDDAGD